MQKQSLALAGGKPSLSQAKHLKWPVLNEDDRAAVLGVLERGVLSGQFAPEVQGLEKEFAAYIGSKYCLTTNSGTAALHMGLAALGVGPGDEVIVPAYTFVATALAVLHQNAIPVFVDVETKTWGMDPELVEAAITPRTRCIIPVHIHGNPCELDALLAIGKKHGIPVFEDACQSHGAEYRGKRVGSYGALGAFSLQSSKGLSCGEGGLLVTNDPQLFERASRTRMFGENVGLMDAQGYRLDRALDSHRDYDSVTMGWMYRMNEMSAALTRSQLKRLDHWNENSRRNAGILNQGLKNLPGIFVPEVPNESVGTFHKYRVRFDATKVGVKESPKKVRDALVKALVAEGVDAVLWQTRPVPGKQLFQDKVGYGKGWPWAHSAPVNYSLDQYPNSTALLDSSVCLFSHTYPLVAQSASLCESYVEAFTKVWNCLDEVLASAKV